ncbi:MAG: hypothetical protein ACI8ZM_005295 [Crocinitomix sp.]|jgi:hypothetical protein
MEEDYEANYHKAREVVALELVSRYGLVESYRDDYKLSLDSDEYSIHLSFYIPYCDELYVSKIVDNEPLGESFRELLYNIYPESENARKVLKKIFSPLKHVQESERYSESVLIRSFLIKVSFLEDNFPQYFNLIT